jgi:tRNA (guanine-N7-)-methyltransferase
MQPQTAHPGQPPRIIYDLPSILERIDVRRLFPNEQPLEIELGSGDGSFLVELASARPTANFIGIERLLGRIRKLERKARSARLLNLRAVRIESAYFLEYLLPAASAAALHIYFPDPWPKRKHQRHRLINERFPFLAAQALAPAGKVYLRTDDSSYFEQMLEIFAQSSLFSKIETPPSLSALKTDFQRQFEAQGIQALICAYEKA